MKKRALAILLLALCCLSPLSAAAKSKPVKKVTLSVTELTLGVGETDTLVPLFKPDGSSAKVKYRSSNPAVVTVGNDGVVTAVAAGTAIVLVKTSNGKKAKCRVTVTDPGRYVAITFDDGPCQNTLEILKVLQQNKAVATFFMLGELAAQNPAIAESVAKAGCQVASHGTNHDSLQKMTEAEAKQDLEASVSAIAAASGATPTVIRAPYGAIDDALAEALGYTFIQWTVDTEDWKSRDAKTVFQRVKADVKPGCIILMHDLYGSTTDALKLVLPELKRQGYSFVTIDQLLEKRGIEHDSGTIVY